MTSKTGVVRELMPKLFEDARQKVFANHETLIDGIVGDVPDREGWNISSVKVILEMIEKGELVMSAQARYVDNATLLDHVRWAKSLVNGIEAALYDPSDDIR